ncbi:MAG: pyrimidine-nucleoside phosphorylase [Thermoflavifilum sp.]|nr:pyrimidine-nucleoside phosphorylase [Thermoflavifilum sp.]MCL6514729.1 pyrimidine-nucleoside phosphorylase [Alicyclobacillus sp.]
MVRMVDFIRKKRLGGRHSREEIRAIIDGYVRGEIPDEQMSAWAMAVVFQGMDDEETAELTMAMAESGDVLDLSDIPGVKVDKHSTGGVGDTTTLVLAPLVASLGVPMAKMSGRGLGHTGGTIDKLESIPGFSAELGLDAFRAQVRRIGVAVAAQTLDLAPADKKLYALRDVTDTVQSLPLIASSIMSKKLASGANAIVLDVKVGNGAFMKDIDSARQLAERMVDIGRRAGRRVTALLTQMEEPLGQAVGNALEVREAIQTLRGQGPKDLEDLCLALGAELLVSAAMARDLREAERTLRAALADGRALEKFRTWVAAQGGDARVADDLSLLPKAPVVRHLRAEADGVVRGIHAEAAGLVAMRLGAGRAKRGDAIDPAVGLVFLRKVGHPVVRGEPVVEVHARTEADAERALRELAQCIEVGEGPVAAAPLILGRVDANAASASSAPGESPDLDALVAAAAAARANAYVPYSGFAVGAALLLADGRIITGVNVENASFGLTNCAERTALFRAVAETGRPQIRAVAVVADSPQPVSPCGACRQVLSEWCDPDVPVMLANLEGAQRQTTVAALLPGAFDRRQMRRTHA